MHLIRFTVFVVGFIALSLSLRAQDQQPRRAGSRIIDDTTRQVYGPNTSHYYYEEDAFFNRAAYYPVDTLIRNFHRFTYLQQTEYMYQDLGNVGTAMRPIFYQAPEVIGLTSGFQAYDLLWTTEKIKYWDTKSPYTNMKVILGGKGRSITKASYSRNIKPRWNFGVNYRGLLIDKQIQRLRKGDRNVRSTYYDAYTSFASKDSTYRLFANFRRNKQEADEYGGIRLTEGSSYDNFFFTNAQPWLTNALSTEVRTNIHLMHEYDLGGKALQLYHVADRYRQTNEFSDIADKSAGYYDYFEIDNGLRTDTASDKNVFRTFRNEVGIKGTLLKLFYNGYYALRTYNMDYKYLNADTLSVKTKGTESYLGGRISLKLDSIIEVTGWGEVMQNGNYRLDGQIRSPWFEASLKQMQYEPTILQSNYRGSHDFWQNSFHAVNLTQLNGYIHYNASAFKVSPGVTFTRLGNYVFFKEGNYDQDQRVLPIQANSDQVILSPELKMHVKFFNHVHLTGRGIYSKLLKSSDYAIRLPELFANAQLAYENIFFHGNFDIQVGVDVHWQSTYYALRYDVPIQQFYVQDPRVSTDAMRLKEFPIVDVFLNAKIKRGRIFVKMNNLVQLSTKQGYLATPYYPGQRNVVDFGFDWSFYD